MKYKFLLILAILFIYASSCEEDEPIIPFDHAAQAIKDNDSLVKYMQAHFINEVGEIEEITGEETSIFDHEYLTTKEVAYSPGDEEIVYNLYYFTINEGVAENENPTRIDKVVVGYKGFTLDGDVFDQNDYGYLTDLYSELSTGVIAGWSHSLIHFKPGNYEVLADQTINYFDQGKGYLFIPSGLAYTDIGKGDVNGNEPLVFYVELNRLIRTDYDDDTILSMFEDVDGDGNYNNDDTDSDGIPNYLDADDDGDGTLTEDEATDEDGDGVLDYLDPDNS